MKTKVENEYLRMLRGDSEVKDCCTCRMGLFYGDEAYKTEDGLYYCPECFQEMMDNEYKINIAERDIELPDDDE